MSNTFDFKQSIKRIFRYSMLATALSATLALILGCLVFWFLAPDLVRLVSMYAGQTQPNAVAPVVPTGPICCSMLAIVSLLFTKKHEVFLWGALFLGVLGIGLLVKEMILLMDLT